MGRFNFKSNQITFLPKVIIIFWLQFNIYFISKLKIWLLYSIVILIILYIKHKNKIYCKLVF